MEGDYAALLGPTGVALPHHGEKNRDPQTMTRPTCQQLVKK